MWVFNGASATFPSGVFSSREKAEAWIQLHGLTGVLTRYPIDIGVYEWTIEVGAFKPKRDDQTTPQFIQRFSSASQEHYHYENGSH